MKPEINNYNHSFNLGNENYFLIFSFMGISFLLLLIFRKPGIYWLSYVICSLLIGGYNLTKFTIDKNNLSKKSQNLLLYRIFWSFTFSIYILCVKFNILKDLGINLIFCFYLLALLDILINISNKKITNELGPGFMPKLNKQFFYKSYNQI